MFRKSDHNSGLPDCSELQALTMLFVGRGGSRGTLSSHQGMLFLQGLLPEFRDKLGRTESVKKVEVKSGGC